MRDRRQDPLARRPEPTAPDAGGRKEPDPRSRGPEAGTTGASPAAASLAALAAVALAGLVGVAGAAPAEAQHAPGDGPPQAEEVEDPAVDARIEGAAALAGERSAETGAAAGQEKSLYERLGGLYPIASVVDVFIDLLLHNDVLNENPAIRKARDEVPTPGLKYHVTAMICEATGGPCEYTGRSMEAAHAHLNIGEREWKAMLSDLRRTLNDFRVPEQEQEELVAIVQSTKDDIVVED